MSNALKRRHEWRPSGSVPTGRDEVERAGPSSAQPRRLPVLLRLPDLRPPATGARPTAADDDPANCSDPGGLIGTDAPRRLPVHEVETKKRYQPKPYWPQQGWVTLGWQLIVGLILIAVFALVYSLLSDRGRSSNGQPHEQGQISADDGDGAAEPLVEFDRSLANAATDADQARREAGRRSFRPPSTAGEIGESIDGLPRGTYAVAARPAGSADRGEGQPAASSAVQSALPPPSGSSSGKAPQHAVGPAGRRAEPRQPAYPHTDPSTYLYPSGPEPERPRSREPQRRVQPAARDDRQPPMATLRGIIQPPPYRDRSRR